MTLCKLNEQKYVLSRKNSELLSWIAIFRSIDIAGSLAHNVAAYQCGWGFADEWHS